MIYESAFNIDVMIFVFVDIKIIADIEIDVMTVFRTYADVAHFQIFITEHLFNSRKTISLLVRNLSLQLRSDEIRASHSVAESIFLASRPHEISSVLIYGNRS